jgi:hypothetical protein
MRFRSFHAVCQDGLDFRPLTGSVGFGRSPVSHGSDSEVGCELKQFDGVVFFHEGSPVMNGMQIAILRRDSIGMNPRHFEGGARS